MSAKKIYLVTRRAGYNFGSSLQAYALQNIFLERGYECEILDMQEMRRRGKIRILILDIIGKVLLFLPFLKRIVNARYFKLLTQSYKQRKKFNYFNSNTLIISKNKLYSESKLKRYIGHNNIIVCGSDQIWNPLGFLPTMFLSFVDPTQNILAAYAPSFGLSQLDSHTEEIKKLINRFHFLSVREEVGVEILRELTNRNVELVLDPTLVVNPEIWKKIECPIHISKKKFLLCYFLSTENYPIAFIENLRKEHNLEVINIQTNYSTHNMENAINRADIGPGNFLYLVSQAEYICTNSFHCCIFSHIYNKEFFVFNRFLNLDKKNQNSRIETLLRVLDKRDRLVDIDCQYHSVGGGDLNSKEAFLSTSINFLNNILSY